MKALALLLTVPAASVTTATPAAAWGKSKKCTDWCTNRSGHKFRIRGH